MLAWISETFGMFFQGANYLLTAMLRIAMVLATVGILAGIIFSIFKHPKKHFKTIAGIIILVGGGFGGNITASHILPDVNWVVAISVYVLIWIIAYKLSKPFFVEKEESDPSSNS
ncbi:hypothetical protein ACFQH5_10370 [Halomonas salifodinae]|uniref:Uncharacterized protein n=1 Tax=Halomonas salifodinae TaxID=438745 RepID=A0ABW2EW73_9GAMM